MILLFGGSQDPNIGVLAKRLSETDTPFIDLRIGAGPNPRLRIDLAQRRMELDGTAIQPTAAFMRNDVFLYETDDVTQAATAALNWHSAVWGWLINQLDVRCFNRQYPLRETDKIGNLLAAADCGLTIPQTVIDSAPEAAEFAQTHIQKPVAGGEYTAMVSDNAAHYPRFIQPRLDRPEMRIYRIGSQMLAFRLESDELDYRTTHDVTLTRVDVPEAEGSSLMTLCDRLGLQFGAADFMTGPGGQLTFLEVNSQPMFAAFDRAADGALCDAIIDALSR